MSAPREPELTALQRHRVERAREIAASDAKAIAGRETADEMTYATAFGATRENVRLLLEVIDELTGGAS